MYVDPAVAQFIADNFVPVRVHVRHQADAFKQLGERYNATWTPTILVLDEQGRERHRIEGFLPVDDFLAQLTLGLGHAAFAANQYGDAESYYQRAVDEHPNTDAAAEALYWLGVSRYKATNDAAALAETAWQFSQRYQDSIWAKKASVWER